MFPSSKFSMIICPYEPNCPRSFQCLFSHTAVTTPPSRKRTYELSQIKYIPIPKPEVKKQISPGPKPVVAKPSVKKNIDVDISQPPYLKPDINAKIPRANRQKALLKYYDEFRRIYSPLLAEYPDLAHRHAYKQEEAVHSLTTKLTYTSKSVSVLQRLRKRSIADCLEDTGIDGEWVESLKEPKTTQIPIDALRKLCMPQLELLKYKYPLLPEMEMSIISEAKKNDEYLDFIGMKDNNCDNPNDHDSRHEEQLLKAHPKTQLEEQICGRCTKSFLVKYPLEDYEKEECCYHFGVLRSTTVEGSKVRAYTCCESTQGASGCSTGPHVFKEDTFQKLHNRIPFVELKELKLTSSNPHLFLALDCEMSYTTAGMECTRITIVSWDGKIILDELVLPSFPVLDLNTRWSGISDLSKAKLTLSDIQNKIASFCSPETILAGHGLENDLKVLRLIHNHVIDTAFIYPHIKGFPYRNSLRSLVTRYLGRFIQTSASGHDSFEDTVSVVQLVKEYLKSHGRFQSVIPRKIPFDSVPKFDDVANLWWKASKIDSWCHSFKTGQKIGLLELDKNVFASNQRKDLISRALKYEASWRAQGTESTKNLGQVRGSTRKPFPQKGRGKARVGTLRAPQFRGGYTVHGPRPHNKTIDIPKKVYDAGLRSAISTKYAQDQVLIVDSLDLTKDLKSELQEKLENLMIKGKKIYFIYGDQEPNVNLIKVSDLFTKKRKSTDGEVENPLLVSWIKHISVTPILDNELLVLDKTAVEVLEEMYSTK